MADANLITFFQFLRDLGCQDSLVDFGVGDHGEFID
jgi:EAL domain-containing protein (putative c-di-GMP-specific phosphodiesterase class I)